MMHVFRVGWIAVLLWLVCPAWGASDGLENEWRLVKDADGIRVYMKHRDDSRLKSFRGVTEVEVVEPFSIAPALIDFENSHKWLHFLSRVEELERTSEIDRIIRATTELPWPLKDRVAIARGVMHQDPETLNVEVNVTDIHDARFPVSDEFVEIPELKARFHVELLPERRIRITYEAIMDPGGFVPTWAANFILKDVPFFTLKKLRKVIAKPEYQGVHYDFLAYPESW